MTIISQLTPEIERFTAAKSRKCPKCRGLLSLEFDHKSGFQKTCLNCGLVEYFGQTDDHKSRKKNSKLRPEGWHVI